MPIFGRIEYSYELENAACAKYCEASFPIDISMRGAELSYRGNKLVLGTYGENKELAQMLLEGIQRI